MTPRLPSSDTLLGASRIRDAILTPWRRRAEH